VPDGSHVRWTFGGVQLFRHIGRARRAGQLRGAVADRTSAQSRTAIRLLGYWIADSAKMAYKARFQPLETLGPGGWEKLDIPVNEALPDPLD